MPVQLPPKKDVALALLQQSTVFIHLDPRVSEVVVPVWFKQQPQLVLQIGLNMPVPITDLQVDDDCVSCTLSFNRSPFFCRIPWNAVFALIGEDRRGMVWPNDVPKEVAVHVQAQARAQRERAERGHLRVVAGESGPAGDEQAAPAAPREPAQAAAAKKKPAKKKPAKKKPAKKKPAKKKPTKKKPAQAAAKQRQPAKSKGGTVRQLVPVSSAQASASGPSAERSKRAKRKLPPYLRVVK